MVWRALRGDAGITAESKWAGLFVRKSEKLLNDQFPATSANPVELDRMYSTAAPNLRLWTPRVRNASSYAWYEFQPWVKWSTAPTPPGSEVSPPTFTRAAFCPGVEARELSLPSGLIALTPWLLYALTRLNPTCKAFSRFELKIWVSASSAV